MFAFCPVRVNPASALWRHPHLTVGATTDEQALERIAQDFAVAAETFLPIPASATEIALMNNTSGPWKVVTTFPLDGS